MEPHVPADPRDDRGHRGRGDVGDRDGPVGHQGEGPRHPGLEPAGREDARPAAGVHPLRRRRTGARAGRPGVHRPQDGEHRELRAPGRRDPRRGRGRDRPDGRPARHALDDHARRHLDGARPRGVRPLLLRGAGRPGERRGHGAGVGCDRHPPGRRRAARLHLRGAGADRARDRRRHPAGRRPLRGAGADEEGRRHGGGPLHPGRPSRRLARARGGDRFPPSLRGHSELPDMGAPHRRHPGALRGDGAATAGGRRSHDAPGRTGARRRPRRRGDREVPGFPSGRAGTSAIPATTSSTSTPGDRGQDGCGDLHETDSAAARSRPPFSGGLRLLRGRGAGGPRAAAESG